MAIPLAQIRASSISRSDMAEIDMTVVEVEIRERVRYRRQIVMSVGWYVDCVVVVAAIASHASEDRATLVGQYIIDLVAGRIGVHVGGVAAACVVLATIGGRRAAGAARTSVGDVGQEAFLRLSEAAVAATACIPVGALPDVVTIVQMGFSTADRLRIGGRNNRIVANIPVVVAVAAVTGTGVATVDMVEID